MLQQVYEIKQLELFPPPETWKIKPYSMHGCAGFMVYHYGHKIRWNIRMEHAQLYILEQIKNEGF